MIIDLKKVLSTSSDCLQSRARLRALLRDLYPQEKREINILLNVYECGIPAKIKNKKSITHTDYIHYLRTIIDEYALDKQYATEGLDAWIDLYLGAGTAERVRGLNEKVSNNKNDIEYREKMFLVDDLKKKPLSPKVIFDESEDDEIAGSSDPQLHKPKCDESLFKYKKIAGGYAISQYVGFDESEISIPDTHNKQRVIRITDSAFKECLSLKRVYLGKHVTILENDAFYGCDSLVSVYGTEQLEFIGHSAFAKCPNLSSITLTNKIWFIGKGAFLNTGLISIDIPESIDYLSSYMLGGCKKLKSIKLHNNVLAIGTECFRKCTQLSKVEIPASVEVIFPGAFSECKGLNKLIIRSKDTSIRFGSNYGYLSNTIVVCKAGSKAYKYCRSKKIKCERLEKDYSAKAQGTLKDQIGIIVDEKNSFYHIKKTLKELNNVDGVVICGEEVYFDDCRKVTQETVNDLSEWTKVDYITKNSIMSEDSHYDLTMRFL